ncbi:hypothetical protein Tdes44962_MAKER08858 [Teratosphaeria destructans]|uniref:Uncharacterized protein n=1 Tax=Teratosphaeria destructans TaxID=418781 RepID=A0A9W7SVF8_9PEZI|nr:hypothetical protein Tdes44962_MAKER08858 [Teratosphaeria destructans]
MAGNRTYYIYPDNSLSTEERFVMQQGYPYVSTTVLRPHGRLNYHGHHSRNTHFIVNGTLNIARANNPNSAFVPWTRWQTHGPRTFANMPRIATYIGEAGAEGCTFVEGHAQLSPTTADRFAARGTIVPVPRGTPGSFTTT